MPPKKPNPFWNQRWMKDRLQVRSRFYAAGNRISPELLNILSQGKAGKRRALDIEVQQQVAIADFLRQKRGAKRIEARDVIAAADYCRSSRNMKHDSEKRIKVKDFKKLKPKAEKNNAADEAIVGRIAVNRNGSYYARVQTKRFGLVWVEYRLDGNDRIDRYNMDFGLVEKGKDSFAFYSEHEESAREMLARIIEKEMEKEQ